MEQWKPAFGFSAYMISSEGRVMNIVKQKGTRPGKILKATNARGYLSLRLRNNGKYEHAYVHRLVLKSFTADHGVQVNHKNGIRSDNRLENLEWCDAAENLTHACRVLGKRRGSHHWNTSITESDVLEMRHAHASGESVMSVTRRYDLSHATISRILNGRIWRHVKLP